MPKTQRVCVCAARTYELLMRRPCESDERLCFQDNNCLFSACGYLCEGRQGSICSELRAAVAEHVRSSQDISEVMLGMPVEQYCSWIKNEMNWGGENEICFLCDKFNVEIQVVMMNASSSALTYGQTTPRSRNRIYLLYTGQHYDALVEGAHDDILPEAETRLFHPDDTVAFDAQVPRVLARAPSLLRTFHTHTHMHRSWRQRTSTIRMTLRELPCQ